MKNESVIIIPARHGSSRFPGKPLALIAGKPMLQWVYELACQAVGFAKVIVTTEDRRVQDLALSFGAEVIMTSDDCLTGTDRVLSACEQLAEAPDYIINLQGDAPLTPHFFVTAVLDQLKSCDQTDVATPYVKLSWDELDALRQHKLNNHFSGTTVTVDPQDNALWFSKNIIPAIRNEATLRNTETKSPVNCHIGVYGYTYKALKQFVSYSESHYEKIEGLEQLRMLENGMHIKAVAVDYQGLPAMTGVDTKEDALKAEKLILSMRAHA